MKVYLVRVMCGDFYCGCGGGHVNGVYTTEDLANEAVEKTNVQKYTFKSWGGQPIKDGAWGSESAYIEEWELDVLPSEVLVW